MGLMILDKLFWASVLGGLVVTSVTDGIHNPGSLHPKGFAADIRSRDIPADVKDWLLRDCKRELGEQFDLVVENDHWHLEFDPD